MNSNGTDSLYENVLHRLAGETPTAPAALSAPRGAAVVIPWRLSAGKLEIYWVERASTLAFMGGWHSFPGGGLNRSDAALAVTGMPRGLAGAAEAAGFPESLLATVETVGPDLIPGILACALRELFEETGILLTAAPDTRTPEALAAARRALLAGEARLPAVLGDGPPWDAGELVYAGRWLTPPFAPLRFDTRFFLLEWPAERAVQPAIWPGELVAGAWIEPRRALEHWRAVEILVAPPTLHVLTVLAEDGPERGLPRLLDPTETNLGPQRRIEMRPGILLFPLAVHTLPPATTVNCYLLGQGDAVLVDPGATSEVELDRLEAALAVAREQLGRRVTALWLTHHHPDHIGGVARLAARLGVPVLAHERTADRLAARGIPVAGTLADGERRVLAGGPQGPEMAFQVLHTPGHARGHLCFLDEASRSLIAGDLVAGLGMIVVDPPEGDMDDYLASLERMAALDPRTLFPGHGPPVWNATAKLRDYVAHRLWREERILAATLAGQTPTAMLPTVYDDVPAIAYPLAERQIQAHLERLRRAGRLAP